MSLDPKDVFEGDWLDLYKKRVEALHLSMSEIRTTYFLYEKLVKFPFHMFSRYPGAFWNLTRKSMFVAIIVGLWRLLYDNDPSSLTVVKMRDEVMTRAKGEEARKRISDLLRQAGVKQRLKSIEAEIRRMRHEHFAHLDVTNVDSPTGIMARGSHLERTIQALGCI